MSDFIDTRSFLAANVEMLLENLSVRRNASKNEAEDLFGGEQTEVQEVGWNLNFKPISKIDILLQEKESLGLYVSGHPLDDYQDLLQWCRDTSARDDVYIILIDKIKKIFTKTNTMMFVLQISVPELEAEGIIFPKNALSLSPLLEEKELYWVKGKVQYSKKHKANALKTLKKESDGEVEEVVEIVKEEGEIKEYDELPKLIIDGLTKFDEGILPLFQSEDIPLARNRLEILKKVNWRNLKTQPDQIPHTQGHSSEATGKVHTAENTSTIPTLFLPKSLGPEKLKEVKAELKTSHFTGSLEVKVEVETSQGSKKVKGSFWTTPQILSLYSVKK